MLPLEKNQTKCLRKVHSIGSFPQSLVITTVIWIRGSMFVTQSQVEPSGVTLPLLKLELLITIFKGNAGSNVPFLNLPQETIIQSLLPIEEDIIQC